MRLGRDIAMMRRLDPLLGPLAATMLGLAIGFFLIAMPGAELDRALAAIGLPGGIARAQPLLALVLAAIACAATWQAFRRFDGTPRVAPTRIAAAGDEAALPVLAPPVLRRADAHPDAPARRPIFAGSDLGTPLDLIDPLPAVSEDDGPAEDASTSDAMFHPLSEEPVFALPPQRRKKHHLKGDGRAGIGEPATDDTVDDDSVVQSQAIVVETASASSEVVAQDVGPPDAAISTDSAVDQIAPGSPAPPAAPVATASQSPASTEALPSLAALIARLEAALARRALAQAGAEPNVTVLRREIRPVDGSLSAAVEQLKIRTAGGR